MNQRCALYTIHIGDTEIVQSKEPHRVCKTFEEAKMMVDVFRKVTSRPAAVWLEEYVNGHWECLESDLYVS